MKSIANRVFWFRFLVALPWLSLAGLNAEPMTLELPESIASQTTALNRKFLLFPPETEEVGLKKPLLIYLHGGGGGRRPLERFKKEMVVQQVRQRALPLTVVIPQRTVNREIEGGWQPDDLNLLLAYLIEHHEIDPNRVYLTGMSMGGAGTWFWANHSPQNFAAVVPVAAGGQTGPKDPLHVEPQSYKSLPVWAFHGNQDRVCPHGQIEELVGKIKTIGGPARFTLYDGVGHGNIVPRVYREDSLYEWLMQQSRSAR